mgnify:FL=1|jgi:hypothetical protein
MLAVLPHWLLSMFSVMPLPKIVVPVAITNTANVGTATEASSHTFSSQSIGAAAAGRIIAVAICTNGGGAGTDGASGVTIGGAAATKAIEITAADHTHSSLWYLQVDAGTSIDIIVTWQRTSNGAGIGVYSVLNSSGSPVSTASDIDDAGAVYTTNTLDIPALGGGIATAIDLKATSPATHTWVGLTENFEQNFKGNNKMSGAALAYEAIQTNITVSCTPSATTYQGSMVTAAWGPA